MQKSPILSYKTLRSRIKKRGKELDIKAQTEAHYRDVAATRGLVNQLIGKLQCQIITPSLKPEEFPETDPHIVALWGERENAVSLLVKLTGLLLKLIPLEQMLLERYEGRVKVNILNDDKLEPDAQYPLPFTEEDRAILAHYAAMLAGENRG